MRAITIGFFSEVEINLPKSSSRSPFLYFAVAACCLLGAANGIGWMFDIPLLVSLFEHLPKMVPATAMLVLGSAASLGFQIDSTRSDTAAATGLLVCAAGLFMLACHLVGAAPHPLQLSATGMQSPSACPHR